MDTGEKIKRRRLDLGLTLEEVGDFVGVTKSTVRKWETGAIENMRKDKIASLAKILKVSPLFIMGIEEGDEPQINIEVPETIAAHFDGEITDDDIDEINQFIEFIKSKK